MLGWDFSQLVYTIMSTVIRKYLLPLHRWTGFTIGLVVLLSAITGLTLIFRDQLEPRVNSDLFTVTGCVSRLPLDTFINKAKEARPDSVVDYIRITRDSTIKEAKPSIIIRYTDQNFIYLNPCSAEILGFKHRYGGTFGVIDQIHRWRFMKNGSLIVGTSAILLGLVMVLGGMVLVFTGFRKSVKEIFILKKGLIGLPRLIDLHKTVGVYIGFVLLLSVMTGLPQAFDWYKRGIYTITGSEMNNGPKRINPPENGEMVSIEEIWRNAQSLVPNSMDALIHYPSAKDEVVEIFMIPEDAPHINARSYLYVNPYDNSVLKFTPYKENTIGFKIYFWTLSWHTGRFGGIIGKLILLSGALGLMFLAYTGTTSYLKKRKIQTEKNLSSSSILRKTP